MSVAKKIAVRAINNYKFVSPITCLGIKCLLNQFDDDNIDSLLPKVLDRKLKVSDSFDKRKYQIYKEGLKDKTYRSMYVPSPTNALIESSFLYKLSDSDYDVSKSVFSYQLPTAGTKSFSSFENYFKMYTEMNDGITTFMNDNKKEGVLIVDIKKFYTSIDDSKALEKFYKRHGNVSLLRDAVVADNGGLTIGINLSHIVAQEYLRDFDNLMIAQFGQGYFRYVDDISIPCDREELDTIVAYVKTHLPQELSVNLDKLDFITRENWSNLMVSQSGQNNHIKFFEIVNLFISGNLDRLDDIESHLRKKNIFLPINRVRSDVTTDTFDRFLKHISKANFFRTNPRRWTIDRFDNFLLDRKKFHLTSLKGVIDGFGINLGSKEIKTRICIRNINFHLSNLYYLLNDEELLEVANLLPEHEGLYPAQCIISCLVDQSFDNLTKLSAKHVSLLAELWISRTKAPFQFTCSKYDSDFIENITYLRLMNVITFNLDDAKSCLEKESSDFLSAVFDKETRIEAPSDYNEELQSLLFRYTEQELKALILKPLDVAVEANYSLESYSLY
ncbi:RNA-directed DNA polymerase [Vibrio splendidus]|uniref:RNA-directed DNA polymerase n=1 Tax=Vibrio splendidus TaxID=29497 RepID=UPI000C85D85B|nr:RNA-directed DNA polymerase [Vibrio splendidus]PMO95002.1 hypothetical protein BCS97_15375 [Vibrio splendidus]PMP24833.1 hypothetical protein BCS89_15205 [Vibrio splendidus]PMP32192.1 hypothetical protein BCS88_15775 [Vibrio splendidus]PMP45501.1 hypothetical protein BCS85_17075 [Vibrio splendidus]PMP47314.1 hypothetical protein BCS87_03040 [Vibrio splendidus]